MVVNLVKCHPVHELVAKLRSGKTISKEQVVRESEYFTIRDQLYFSLTSMLSEEQGRRC